MTTAETLAAAGLVLAFVTALAALVTAIAASRSAKVAERASLLGAIPLLVPWIEKSESRLKVKNRGHADAHELSWRIVADGEEVLADSITDVIQVGGTKNLTSERNAVIDALRTKSEAVVACEYLTSWGEYLTLERTYVGGKSQGLRLVDSRGRRLTIGRSVRDRGA